MKERRERERERERGGGERDRERGGGGRKRGERGGQSNPTLKPVTTDNIQQKFQNVKI